MQLFKQYGKIHEGLENNESVEQKNLIFHCLYQSQILIPQKLVCVLRLKVFQ